MYASAPLSSRASRPPLADGQWFHATVEGVNEAGHLRVVGGTEVWLAGVRAPESGEGRALARKRLEEVVPEGTALLVGVSPYEPTAIQHVGGRTVVTGCVHRRSDEQDVAVDLVEAGLLLPYQASGTAPALNLAALLDAHQRAVGRGAGIWGPGGQGRLVLLGQVVTEAAARGHVGRESWRWFRAAVEHVTDADTVRMVGGRALRLLGIDGFERETAEGRLATDRLRQLLSPGESVDVALADSDDGYGRLLGWLHDPADGPGDVAGLIQGQLAREGLVVPYRLTKANASPYWEVVVEAAHEAAAAERGVWAVGAMGPSLLARRHYGRGLERQSGAITQAMNQVRRGIPMHSR